jgi:hypothetical protein
MIALFGLRGAPQGYTLKSVRIGGTENYAEEALELLEPYPHAVTPVEGAR